MYFPDLGAPENIFCIGWKDFDEEYRVTFEHIVESLKYPPSSNV